MSWVADVLPYFGATLTGAVAAFGWVYRSGHRSGSNQEAHKTLFSRVEDIEECHENCDKVVTVTQEIKQVEETLSCRMEKLEQSFTDNMEALSDRLLSRFSQQMEEMYRRYVNRVSGIIESIVINSDLSKSKQEELLRRVRDVE